MPQNNLLPSILIVDDEIPARSELIRIIKQINSDFPIYEAESGKEAVSQLDQINCDIVFSGHSTLRPKWNATSGKITTTT